MGDEFNDTGPDKGIPMSGAERNREQLRAYSMELVSLSPGQVTPETHIAEIENDFRKHKQVDREPTLMVARTLNQLEEDGEISRWIYVPNEHTLNALKADVLVITPDNRIVPIQITATHKASKQKDIQKMYGHKPVVHIVETRHMTGFSYTQAGVANQIRVGMAALEGFTIK